MYSIFVQTLLCSSNNGILIRNAFDRTNCACAECLRCHAFDIWFFFWLEVCMICCIYILSLLELNRNCEESLNLSAPLKCIISKKHRCWLSHRFRNHLHNWKHMKCIVVMLNCKWYIVSNCPMLISLGLTLSSVCKTCNTGNLSRCMDINDICDRLVDNDLKYSRLFR